MLYCNSYRSGWSGFKITYRKHINRKRTTRTNLYWVMIHYYRKLFPEHSEIVDGTNILGCFLFLSQNTWRISWSIVVGKKKKYPLRKWTYLPLSSKITFAPKNPSSQFQYSSHLQFFFWYHLLKSSSVLITSKLVARVWFIGFINSRDSDLHMLKYINLLIGFYY